jgi:hypothetical protein
MAHPSGLSLWAFIHREKLQLTSTAYTWPQQLGCPWFDMDAMVVMGDRPFIGRGTAFDAATAFDIAVSAAMERSVYHSLGERRRDYAGFSAHLDLGQATDSAICELLERDAFFCHYLTQTPFLKKVDLSLLGDELGELPSYFARHAVQIESRTLCMPENFSGVITVALGKQASRPFGLFVGLGCKKSSSDLQGSLKSALRSSLIECLRNLTAWLENDTAPAMAYDHNALARNIDQCGGLMSLLFPLDWELKPAQSIARFSAQSPAQPIDERKIRIEGIPFNSSQDVPLVFAGVSHEECIPTYFGPFKSSARALGRLSRFLSRPVRAEEIFMAPHPIG